jgi:hypothetical protein
MEDIINFQGGLRPPSRRQWHACDFAAVPIPCGPGAFIETFGDDRDRNHP